MQDAVNAVSSIADKNDRWLLIALVILILVFAWKVIQHLVVENEKSRTAHHAVLERMAGESVQRMATLQICVDRNTDALQGNSTVLERCHEALSKRHP